MTILPKFAAPFVGLLMLMLTQGVVADVGSYEASVTALSAPYGLYNANVPIANGTYRVSVRIENDEITRINWSDGTQTSVTGGALQGVIASAMSLQGQPFRIEVTDDRYHREDTGNGSASDSQPDDD